MPARQCSTFTLRPRFSIRTLLIVIVASAVISDVVRRWMNDPATSRLASGSTAVLDPQHPGSLAVYIAPGRAVDVRFGSRVEVISDSRSADKRSDNSLPDGALVFGDNRDVTVRVIEGEHSGLVGEAGRFYLRPIRR